jgi:hypothetical protein
VKALRIYAASLVLMLAAILAHILAGGQVISFHSGAILAFVALLQAILLDQKFERPGFIAFTIFASQNIAHFILGGSAANPNVMAMSHIASGLLSYKIIQYFVKALPSIIEIFVLFLLPRISARVEPVAHIRFLPSFSYRSLATRSLSLATALRAPPSY